MIGGKALFAEDRLVSGGFAGAIFGPGCREGEVFPSFGWTRINCFVVSTALWIGEFETTRAEPWYPESAAATCQKLFSDFMAW